MTTPRIAAPAVPSAARIPGGRFGNQPALDGLRAISVIAVILYHAGFGWMVGGFYGVEVFFVVSGFLITTLLIEERERSGGNSLGQFWLRRARRLLPALFTLLAAVALWAWMFGTAEQQAQLRSDLPWSIFYVANWGQIVGKIPYYSSGDPLLRHLWSLAVEEQWYLVWPLAFLGLAVLGWSRWRNAAILFGLFLAIWAAMAVAASGSLQTPLRIPLLGTVDRTNFMYLSSITRAGGLLLGAAAAYIWRPWRRVNRSVALGLEGLAAAALTGIVLIFCFARLNEPYTFQFVLPLVSLFSLIVVAAAVHPAAPGIRRLLSGKALVAVGRRSYGIYLWHWPIFVFAGADHASIGRVVLAAVITAVVSELCFRYIETPVRHGAIGRLWGRWSELQHDRAGIGLLAAGVILPGLLVVALFTHYAAVKPFDRAAGGSDVAFAEPVSTSGPSPSVSSTTPAGGQPSTTTVVGAAPSSTTAAGSPVLPGPSESTTSTPDARPLRVTVVGDSMAHALAINQPKGLATNLTISDGSIDGCDVFDSGRGVSSEGFKIDFARCAGWQDRWAAATRNNHAEVALVVIGAWDVLDVVQSDGSRLAVGTPAHDEAYLAQLQKGIDAVAATGAKVAFLQVACMRPVNAKGAATPPLPERADDNRANHLSALFRQAVARNPATTAYITGPAEWCNGSKIASDTGYRWDGVHVYKPGANLIYTTVLAQLQQLHLS